MTANVKQPQMAFYKAVAAYSMSCSASFDKDQGRKYFVILDFNAQPGSFGNFAPTPLFWASYLLLAPEPSNLIILVAGE